MGLRVHLYGQSPALYLLGAALRRRSLEVRCFEGWVSKREEFRRKRPVRLSPESVRIVEDVFREYAKPHFFLSEAVSLQSWGRMGAESFKGLFDNDSATSVLVPLDQLRNELRELFIASGGIIEDNRVLHKRPAGRNPHCIEVMDIDPLALMPEERASYFSHFKRRPVYHVAEFRCEASENEGPDFEFLRYENSLLICERFQESSIISAYSSSKYGRSRVVQSLCDVKSTAPAKWKAMIVESGRNRQFEYSLPWGWSGFYRPGVWGLGASLGRISPLSNLEFDESLKQAERLCGQLDTLSQSQSSLLQAEDWRKSEKSKLASRISRGRISERLLFKESWTQGTRQKVVSVLPPSVRQMMASPV